MSEPADSKPDKAPGFALKNEFGDLIEAVLLEFVNTKLDLYNKLSEQKVKTALKERWFGEFEAISNRAQP